MIVLGMVSCLLAGCGNVIPELTEEEASLIATYAADVMLENSRENLSRLMDTEAETARLDALAEKVAQLKKKQSAEEETKDAESSGASSGVSSGVSAGASASASAGSSAGTSTGTEVVSGKVENIASFIGLDGFQVSFDGYEIKKSYSAKEGADWEPIFDASAGKNLLIMKLNVTNSSGAPAVLDVLSKDMLFSVSGDNGISGMALVTMLLNDFAYAQDEIGAGESKQYVLITQINETITEVGSLTLQMKKGDERANVTLQ